MKKMNIARVAFGHEWNEQTFGVGCRERSAAKRNVESRHLTPIGLRGRLQPDTAP
jgi:hypothetical protein